MADAQRANRLGALATALSDRIARLAEEATGLSPSAAAALAVIAQQPGLTIDDLRLAVGRSHPAAVRIVDRLEAGGLVARRPSGHGRALAIVPTATGRRRARAYVRRRAEVLGELVGDVGPEAAEALDDLLARLLSRLASLPDGIEVCRFCDKGACRDGSCPVVARLREAGIEPPPPVSLRT